MLVLNPKGGLMKLSIVLISCIDAYLTLLMIENKIVLEGNPVMAYYLDFGAITFFVVKYSFTALSVIILCILKNSFVSRAGLFAAMFIYLVVVLYELHIVYIHRPAF